MRRCVQWLGIFVLLGCCCFVVVFPGGSPLVRTYLRFANTDVPPVEEFYVRKDGVFQLYTATFDTDGDWIYDTTVRFKSTSGGAVERVFRHIEGVAYTNSTCIRLYLVQKGLDPETLMTEPPSCWASNRTKFQSSAYRQMLFRMLRNFKSGGERCQVLPTELP